MLALVLLASSLPMSLAIWIMFTRARAQVRADAVALLEARGEQLVSELDRFHAGYLRPALQLAGLLALQAPRAGDEQRALAPVLDVFFQNVEHLRGITLIDRQGKVLASTQATARGLDLSQRTYFREVMKGSPYISDVFFAKPLPDPTPIIAYAAPIRGPDGALTGAAVIYVKASAFWDAVRAANGRAGPGSFSVLYDRFGVRIAHSFNDGEVFRPAGRLRPEAVQEMMAEQRFGERTRALLEDVSPAPEEFARALAPGPARGDVFSGYSPANGLTNLAVTKRLRMVPWTVFCLVPEASLEAPVATLAGTMAVGGGLLVVLALVVGLVFARRIVQPLGALGQAVAALRAGDLRARVAAPGEDEVGHLAAAFNEMAGALLAGRETLEARVRERTLALERANEELVAQKEELVAQKEELAIQQKELHGKSQELERANRLKSAFLANMSHELRTPLNAIIGFSEILLDDPAGHLAPGEREQLGHVLDSGRHLLALINDILDLSKIEAGVSAVAIEPLSPRQAIDEAVALMQAAAGRKQIVVRPEVLTTRLVRADSGKLRQILLNLLSNAVKFAPERSLVRVTVDSSGALLRFGVADQGAGIDQELMPRLFEPFVQGESPLVKKHQGTGLGLAICKRLVELQGGTISVDSAPGSGASFSFTLPAVAATDLGPSGGADGALVLVVDADARFAAELRRPLEAAGYRVVAFDNGRDVATVAAELAPAAIVLDPATERRDGIGLLDALARRQETRAIPVVMSRLPRPASLLSKPIDPQEILGAIARLGGQRPAAGLAVLAVDDDPRVHEVLAAVLVPAGHRLRSATGGREGLAAARAQPPDVVIIDLLMPDLSGFDLIEALGADASTSGLPVIVLTAADLSPEDRERLRARVRTIARKGDVTEAELLTALDAATAPARLAQAVTGTGRTIVVVDDNDVNRELARAMLERRGHRVLMATDGQQGVELTLRERPDLVFMDLAMPGKDGYTAARELKADARTARIPIVALTAMAMSGDEEKAYAAGIDGYLTKPIDRRALEETLLRFLAD
jgi:signal transduction histidine kinase/CheY-like chemotaxis protein